MKINKFLISFFIIFITFIGFNFNNNTVKAESELTVTLPDMSSIMEGYNYFSVVERIREDGNYYYYICVSDYPVRANYSSPDWDSESNYLLLRPSVAGMKAKFYYCYYPYDTYTYIASWDNVSFDNTYRWLKSFDNSYPRFVASNYDIPNGDNMELCFFPNTSTTSILKGIPLQAMEMEGWTTTLLGLLTLLIPLLIFLVGFWKALRFFLKVLRQS